MGLLDKLWDETLAGPRPENGLGKLRKTESTNSAMANPSTPELEEALSRLRERRASADFQRLNDEAKQVTQSITIMKPPGYLRSLSVDTTTSSPAASSPLNSPSSLTPRERESPWRSKMKNNNMAGEGKNGSEKSQRAEPRSPTVYDWVVITSLER
uniref:Dormancy/auxin associated-like protein n=1 Tax=Picea sitchensis TaxID=3332 RepID=C0PTU0_PICSI|nr:unknown [Picea sitchensis]